MAILRVIIVGDKTTHGGTVIQGSHGVSVSGKAVSLQGDLVSCPQCKGNFPIVQGAKRMSNNGRGVALEGMKTACGAILIGSQNLMWVEDDSLPDDATSSFVEDETVEKRDCGIQFYLTDDVGKPYKNTKFSIKFLDRNENGITDENGKTPFYPLDDGEPVEIRLHIIEEEWEW